MRWPLIAVALLMVVGCADDMPLDHEFTGLTRVFERYGTGYIHNPTAEAPRLEVHLTGRRWRGMRSGVHDSAAAVARHALASLPSDMQRPDTVVVTFQIRNIHILFFKSTAVVGDTIAVEDL